VLVGREEDRELYCHTIHAVESTNAPRVEGLSVAVPFHLDDSRRGVARPACLGRPRADAGPEAAKTAMAPLGWLVGRWSGEGTHTGPEGTREFRQTEHIRPALEGSLLVIEGTGREPAEGAEPGAVVFRAFAVVSAGDETGPAAARCATSSVDPSLTFGTRPAPSAWPAPKSGIPSSR
jgi:hypothetical protein